VSQVQFYENKSIYEFSEKYIKSGFIDKFLINKRTLTSNEIRVLKNNNNKCSEWKSIFVSEFFDPDLIHNSQFHGTVIIGNLSKGVLKFHDLILDTGINNSLIISSVIGDNCSVTNVKYMSNYVTGANVILFNVAEINTSEHPKFGNGIIKEGEDENDRVRLEVANENGGRAIIPFDTMICSDAYLWSRHRDDSVFQNKLLEITDSQYDKKRGEYGFIGDNTVIKNSLIIKDAKIGANAYIKGASKLKNITIHSSAEEPSQIGEGVELVNGIMGFGSKAFYQAVAVRFVIGRNCQIKYGARVINSVLGDNSTVSCCEILNNLLFPYHEQHHNTSFLIASTVMGQSNIAAGATIGSNHNSRSPDGEIIAGRGFWPGLCTDFKHNSVFASFCLIAKGSYQQELHISYPFSLVFTDSKNESINIMPGYWFMYNMYAMARNSYKFKLRDKRKIKVQHIETDFLAPDTVSEILKAMDRIKTLTSLQYNSTYNDDEITGYLLSEKSNELTLVDTECMKKFGATIVKPSQAYIQYRKMALYFALKTLIDYFDSNTIEFSFKTIQDINKNTPYTQWDNIGGQLIPADKVKNLISSIKKGFISSWESIHEYYNICHSEYSIDKTRYSLFVIEKIYNKSFIDFTEKEINDLISIVSEVAQEIYNNSYSSRQKDYEDPFRNITYSSKEEMIEVIGSIDENDFLLTLKKTTNTFIQQLSRFSNSLK